jgi:hypothetical protein
MIGFPLDDIKTSILWIVFKGNNQLFHFFTLQIKLHAYSFSIYHIRCIFLVCTVVKFMKLSFEINDETF